MTVCVFSFNSHVDPVKIIISPILWIRNLRLREIKQVIQVYIQIEEPGPTSRIFDIMFFALTIVPSIDSSRNKLRHP